MIRSDRNNYHSIDCDICKNNIGFEIPKILLNDLLSGEFALFAGAGISQELPSNGLPTFYGNILESLGLEDEIPFPELMEKYCEQSNGRVQLLIRIKDYFDKINSFSELREHATRFHREIATFFPLQTIVTTNWDMYFEEECAATPFITAQDLVFWNTPGRKVLKIHGSISNYGSIIATSSDYRTRIKELNRGIIGGTLKHILATQTIIFAGYSCRDSDFLSIYKMIRKELGELHKQAYIITLDKESDSRYADLGLIPIYTDATYFFSIIKEHALHETHHYISDQIYDIAKLLLLNTRENHEKLVKTIDFHDYPEVLFSVFYQDGLMHGFDRIINKRNTGTYSHACYIIAQIDLYEKISKQTLKRRRYEDVAYIEGYLNALRFITMFENVGLSIEDLPMYHVFGNDEEINTIDELIELLPSLPSAHKSAHKRINLLAKKYANSEDVDVHHPPILSYDPEPIDRH